MARAARRSCRVMNMVTGLDPQPRCKHNASMPNVLIRDLPDDVHAALHRKAEQRNQSLQQYLTSELRQLAERQQLSDVLAEVETRRGGRVGLRQAVEALGDECARR
ncbi:hypothetical protein BH24ACT11_BH24ACT11_04200 [soil metagenome]